MSRNVYSHQKSMRIQIFPPNLYLGQVLNQVSILTSIRRSDKSKHTFGNKEDLPLVLWNAPFVEFISHLADKMSILYKTRKTKILLKFSYHEIFNLLSNCLPVLYMRICNFSACSSKSEK